MYIDLDKNSEFIWGVKWFIKYQIYDFCWYKNMCKIFIFTGKLYVFAAWILTRKYKHLLDEKICFLWNNEWKAWILMMFNLRNFYSFETIKRLKEGVHRCWLFWNNNIYDIQNKSLAKKNMNLDIYVNIQKFFFFFTYSK